MYLTSGTAFPDAVAGAPAAAKEGAPLLLIQQSGIPADTARELERLRPSEIVILGASGVVAPEVDDAAALFAPTVTRLAGSSRYSTAAAIAGAATGIAGRGVRRSRRRQEDQAKNNGGTADEGGERQPAGICDNKAAQRRLHRLAPRIQVAPL